MGPLLRVKLQELVRGRRGGGSGASGGNGRRGGNGIIGSRSSGDGRIRGNGGGVGWSGVCAGTKVAGGAARVQASYEAHLPALSFWDERNWCTIMARALLPIFQGHVISNNWHRQGMFWEDSELKNLHVPTSPEISAGMNRLLKTA